MRSSARTAIRSAAASTARAGHGLDHRPHRAVRRLRGARGHARGPARSARALSLNRRAPRALAILGGELVLPRALGQLRAVAPDRGVLAEVLRDPLEEIEDARLVLAPPAVAEDVGERPEVPDVV